MLMNTFRYKTCCKGLTTCNKMQQVVIRSDFKYRIVRAFTQLNSPFYSFLTDGKPQDYFALQLVKSVEGIRSSFIAKHCPGREKQSESKPEQSSFESEVRRSRRTVDI